MAAKRLARIAGLVALAALAMAGAASAALPVLAPESLCSAETGRYESRYGIPPQLLDAISIVESGRWDDVRRATIAWPWTVTAAGQGKYFPTKADAVAEVKRLRAAGVRNIDVGCMQVNLQYHPDAFSSLEEAFDPAANVAYAARFLKGLFQATNHWPTAASYYHSQTPKLAAEYRDRLMKVWSGASGRTELASAVSPRSTLDPLRRPARDAVAGHTSPSSDDVAGREEARRIADAYRQARLAEYRLRRARMVETRRALGLSLNGY
ncbi:MAG: transglycosylase SLT domain-containing protein [Magnetospirillum sp.]|nr:transglycosylase SLT domain-containing protein [Magnetospirillum sp.]